MKKDFDSWNTEKKQVELLSKQIFFNEGDIGWCSLGLNIKTETCGKGSKFRRPLLILKKLSSDSCIVIPASTQSKKGTWFATYKLHGEMYTALWYQIRTIHINRLTVKVGELDSKEYTNIKKRLKSLLNL